MKVMKRMLALVLFVTLLVGLIPTTALEVKAKKIRTRDGWVLQHKFRGDYDMSYYATKYVGKASKVTLPVMKDGYLVIESISDTVEEIHIPDGVEMYMEQNYSDGLLYTKNLKRFTVSSSHELYTVKEGILFAKDLKTLICYPRKKWETPLLSQKGRKLLMVL